MDTFIGVVFWGLVGSFALLFGFEALRGAWRERGETAVPIDRAPDGATTYVVGAVLNEPSCVSPADGRPLVAYRYHVTVRVPRPGDEHDEERCVARGEEQPPSITIRDHAATAKVELRRPDLGERLASGQPAKEAILVDFGTLGSSVLRESWDVPPDWVRALVDDPDAFEGVSGVAYVESRLPSRATVHVRGRCVHETVEAGRAYRDDRKLLRVFRDAPEARLWVSGTSPKTLARRDLVIGLVSLAIGVTLLGFAVWRSGAAFGAWH